MALAVLPEPLRGWKLVLHWRRLRTALLTALILALLFGMGWKSRWVDLLLRECVIALACVLVFGVFEHWPRTPPQWLARWVLQVVAVALVVPCTVWTLYVLSTPDGAPPFWREGERLTGFMLLTVSGILIAPWIALGALVRQKEALARHQALGFELKRSELERQALDARLNLLQAQVAPHFLFNTLANVQVLVQSGSPRAATVLEHLIAYLRAAVPRLDAPVSSVAEELRLVRAYLELMHLRMPDRLRFTIDADPRVLTVACPPVALLTLVENAVRHGIDPAEEGGHIAVRAMLAADGACVLQVADTGVGLDEARAGGLGTGLVALRERLRLKHGAGAQLRLLGQPAAGVLAEIRLPPPGGAA